MTDLNLTNGSLDWGHRLQHRLNGGFVRVSVFIYGIVLDDKLHRLTMNYISPWVNSHLKPLMYGQLKLAAFERYMYYRVTITIHIVQISSFCLLLTTMLLSSNDNIRSCSHFISGLSIAFDRPHNLFCCAILHKKKKNIKGWRMPLMSMGSVGLLLYTHQLRHKYK